MSRSRSSIVRLVTGALLTAAAAAGATSGSHAPVDPPRAADDALSAAKQELQTLNSLRGPELQERAALPRIAGPELQTGLEAPPPALRPPSTESPRPTNWLVEAMARAEREARGRDTHGAPRGARDSRTRDSRTGGDRLVEGVDAASQRHGVEIAAPAALPGDAGADERAREPARGPQRQSVVNPLARYLGDWMSPQDYILLKPGLASSPAGTGGASTPDSPFTATVLSEARTHTGSFEPGLTPAAAPRENPYLQTLTPPAPMPRVTPPAATANLAPVQRSERGAVASPLPAPAPRPDARVPDFAKPAADEKYFKPLKRF